jgi:glycosyltransferase involved in cell wall biosynthesis
MQSENIEFWLAGDYKAVAGGSIYESLQEAISSLNGKVKVLGKLSEEDLVRFYSEIDLLLLPSTNRFEAFGMVQMEAMTFGALVVTSDMPGVRETVLRTGMGELAQPGSVASLVEAIKRALIIRARTSRDDVARALSREFSNDSFEAAYLTLIDNISS